MGVLKGMMGGAKGFFLRVRDKRFQSLKTVEREWALTLGDAIGRVL